MEFRTNRWRDLIRDFMIVICINSVTVFARNIERYDTAYECEGKTLKIECQEGELIHLIRANYGRFSITICNEHGNTDWSVNCMSPKSFRVLYNKCNQQQNCSIMASTSQFDDPCPNTLKYLEAHYQCISASTTTSTTRPSPPWLLTSQPVSWNTSPSPVSSGSRSSLRPKVPDNNDSDSNSSSISSLGKAKSSNVSSSTSASETLRSPPVRPWNVNQSIDVEESQSGEVEDTNEGDNSDETIEENEDEENDELKIMTPVQSKKLPTTPELHLTTEIPESPTPLTSTVAPWKTTVGVCPRQKARNLFWNATRLGEIAIQSCPGGTNGIARWQCVHKEIDNSERTVEWQRGSPDLSECRSVWLSSLEKRVREGELILGVSSDLSQVTNNSRELYGGDMLITTKILRNMAERMAEDVRTYGDIRQREASVAELLQGAVMTGSNLLDRAQDSSWKDLSYQEQMEVATSLLIGLEENAFLYANTLAYENFVLHEQRNILMEVRVLEVQNMDSELEVFPQKSTKEKHWAQLRDRIELTQAALLANSDNKDRLVRLVFMAFERLEEILQPQFDFNDDQTSLNEDRGNIKKQSQQQNNGSVKRILNSKVIAASLSKGKHVQLVEPVRLYFEHLSRENVSNARCVYWDYTTNNWSEEGCLTLHTNNSHTFCECNHLTNFAVLMDVHAVKLELGHQFALQIITYVGCVISIVCLVLAILTFQLFRSLKSDRTTIHKNLCICLLIAELLFICGIGQTSQKVICGVIAGLLHFFFLSAFAWMFFEGFQLYVMLIEVFEAEKSRLRWYYLAAYGAPLLVVAISSLIDPFSYGTERYCWLRADNYFIFSFVGPVILVILANLVFLSMAIYMMCRHANSSISMKSKEHSRLANARAWLRGAIVLVFLLGLTWTFGLLYLNQESVLMAYIFTVLNSLQGLFIFVFHCIQNEKARKEYRKFVRRHAWLPRCLRCSNSATTASGSSGGGGCVGNSGSAGSGNSAGPNPHCHGSSKELSSHCNISSNPPDASIECSGLSTSRFQHQHHHQHQLQHHQQQHPSQPQPHSHHLYHQHQQLNVGHSTSFKSHSLECDQDDLGQKKNVGSISGQDGHYNIGAASTLQGYGLRSRERRLIAELEAGSHATTGRRAASPYNHTYTEISESRHQHQQQQQQMTLRQLQPVNYGFSNRPDHEDPVYEEIERNCHHGPPPLTPLTHVTTAYELTDMSDDENRRQSDMSRQSSRSYGDHRPLIPYSPAQERGLEATWALEKQLRRQHHHQFDPSNEQSIQQQHDHTRTVAVLDGHTVVCHLQPQTEIYTTRGLAPPSYSEC